MGDAGHEARGAGNGERGTGSGEGMRAVFLGENLLYLRAVIVSPMSGKRNRMGGRFSLAL